MIRSLAIIGLAAAFAFPARAQTPGIGGLNGTREESRQIMLGQGYIHAVGPIYMLLDAGGRQSVRIPVAKGVGYKVVGLCDANCSDFDLMLRSSDGQDIGSDLLPDDFPVVNGLTDANTVVEIEGIMVACSRAPCYAVIDVFWQP